MYNAQFTVQCAVHCSMCSAQFNGSCIGSPFDASFNAQFNLKDPPSYQLCWNINYYHFIKKWKQKFCSNLRPSFPFFFTAIFLQSFIIPFSLFFFFNFFISRFHIYYVIPLHKKIKLKKFFFEGCKQFSRLRENRSRGLRITNRQNKGLISVDRKTSLLSRLQYPVLYQSRLQRIFYSQCPKGE